MTDKPRSKLRRLAEKVLGEDRAEDLAYARSAVVRRLPLLSEGARARLDPSLRTCSRCRFFDVEAAQRSFAAHPVFEKVQTALTPSQMAFGKDHHGGAAWDEYGACEKVKTIVDPDHSCPKWKTKYE